MENTCKIIWSDEALINLKGIIDYLETRWTKNEIYKFSQLLDHQLNLIKNNPFLYPEYPKLKGLRKSVLSKQISIYYRVIQKEVHIITLFDNRQNPKSLKNIL